MCGEQDCTNSRLYRDRAHRMPAQLPVFVLAVKGDEASGIFKRQRRKLKRNSVLALVQLVLPLIPFVAHSVYTYCSTNAMAGGPGPEKVRLTKNSGAPYPPQLGMWDTTNSIDQRNQH